MVWSWDMISFFCSWATDFTLKRKWEVKPTWGWKQIHLGGDTQRVVRTLPFNWRRVISNTNSRKYLNCLHELCVTATAAATADRVDKRTTSAARLQQQGDGMNTGNRHQTSEHQTKTCHRTDSSTTSYYVMQKLEFQSPDKLNRLHDNWAVPSTRKVQELWMKALETTSKSDLVVRFFCETLNKFLLITKFMLLDACLVQNCHYWYSGGKSHFINTHLNPSASLSFTCHNLVPICPLVSLFVSFSRKKEVD